MILILENKFLIIFWWHLLKSLIKFYFFFFHLKFPNFFLLLLFSPNSLTKFLTPMKEKAISFNSVIENELDVIKKVSLIATWPLSHFWTQNRHLPMDDGKGERMSHNPHRFNAQFSYIPLMPNNRKATAIKFINIAWSKMERRRSKLFENHSASLILPNGE